MPDQIQICLKDKLIWQEELQKIDAPFITNIGRKGGSSCAASIVNALFKLLKEN